MPKLPCCEFTSLSCSAHETSIEKDLISLEALSWTIWKICNQDNSPGTHVPQRMNPDPPLWSSYSFSEAELCKLHLADGNGGAAWWLWHGSTIASLLCRPPPGAPKRGDIRKKVEGWVDGAWRMRTNRRAWQESIYRHITGKEASKLWSCFYTSVKAVSSKFLFCFLFCDNVSMLAH